MSSGEFEAGPSGNDDGDQNPPNSDQIRFYGVVPKVWCEHLEENVNSVPPGELDAETPCGICQDKTENWICLQCYQVYCSRFVNGDMKRHMEETGHQIVLSFADLSVWCFACDSYVNNSITQPAKEAAYLSKFGEVFPVTVQGTEDEVER